MLYDWTGKEIPEGEKANLPIGERLVRWEDSDRSESDESRALTPTRLDSIFREANAGTASAQARLAAEIEEKDWDIAQALGTRRAAVEGIDWKCQPAIEDDSLAKEIADAAQKMLGGITAEEHEDLSFDGCIDHMLTAILPGYAWLEIMWAAGGAAVRSFAAGITSGIKFKATQEPLIVTRDKPLGRPMAPNKFVFHKHKARSGDATRGGLIRPLGWMYLFANLGVKDLVRFVEKFGMPFVVARLDDNSWEKDRNRIKYLVQNFGSDGGGVFSKAVELELTQAASNDGSVYFQLLDYFGAAKTKVILGQTATSGDAGGFSKGQAQADVRQDILEADCDAIAVTVRRDVLRPWTMFNYGADAPVPVFKFNCEPPEDLKDKADVVKTLFEAGYQVSVEHVQEQFGMPVTLKADLPSSGADGVALVGEKKKTLSSPRHSRRTNRW